MMKQNYLDRAMRARDPRFAKIAQQLGYATKAPKDGLKELRSEYQNIFGKKAFHGWDAEALQEKIAASKIKQGDD